MMMITIITIMVIIIMAMITIIIVITVMITSARHQKSRQQVCFSSVVSTRWTQPFKRRPYTGELTGGAPGRQHGPAPALRSSVAAHRPSRADALRPSRPMADTLFSPGSA